MDAIRFMKAPPVRPLTVLVRVVGLEPTRIAAQEPKGCVTAVKDFQSPPYRKGRTSFQRFKRYSVVTGRYLLNHSTLCRKSIA